MTLLVVSRIVTTPTQSADDLMLLGRHPGSGSPSYCSHRFPSEGRTGGPARPARGRSRAPGACPTRSRRGLRAAAESRQLGYRNRLVPDGVGHPQAGDPAAGTGRATALVHSVQTSS